MRSRIYNIHLSKGDQLINSQRCTITDVITYVTKWLIDENQSIINSFSHSGYIIGTCGTVFDIWACDHKNEEMRFVNVAQEVQEQYNTVYKMSNIAIDGMPRKFSYHQFSFYIGQDKAIQFMKFFEDKNKFQIKSILEDANYMVQFAHGPIEYH